MYQRHDDFVIYGSSMGDMPAPPRLTAAAYAGDEHAPPSVALPGYLESYIDPVFGAKITRISGTPGTDAITGATQWSDDCRHDAATVSAWNANSSRMLITAHGARDGANNPAPERLLLDGRTYAIIRAIEPLNSLGVSASDCRWHPIDPDVLICTAGNEVFAWSVSVNARSAITAIAGATALRIQGSLSKSGNLLVVMDGQTAWLLNITTGDVIGTHVFNAPQTDGVTITASGTHVAWNGAEVVGENDRTRLFSPRFESVRFLSSPGNPSRYDTGIDAAGHEVLCGTNNNLGRVMTHRLTDGAEAIHAPGGYCQRSSLRNIKEPGWAFCTFGNAPGYSPLQSEIAKIKLDGSVDAERWCHHRSDQIEAQASASPSGRRCVFATDWGTTNGPVYTMVAEYPDN